MSSPHTRVSLLRGLAPLVVVGSLAPGCFLAPPIGVHPPPEFSTSFRCTAQIQSAGGHVEAVSSLTHSDLTRVVSGYRQPIREFGTCFGDHCPPCDYYQSEEAVLEEWRRSIDFGVPLLADDPATRLGSFDGPWCVWPDTVACTPAGVIHTGLPTSCTPAEPQRELAHCQGTPPPAGERCLEITCNGEPCEGYDFGTLQANVVSAPLRVRVRNCGDGLSERIAVVVEDDPLDRTLGPSDPGFFLVPVPASRSCEGTRYLYSDSIDPGRNECWIDVAFATRQVGGYSATLEFFSTPLSAHRIEMRARSVSE